MRRALALAVLWASCVSDLEVGVERAVDAGRPDAPDAGALDAGLPACAASDCAGQDAGSFACDAGAPTVTCVRAEDGSCRLVADACPPPIPTGPCEQVECDGPLLVPPDRERACADDSAATCERDPATGLCSYQCPPQFACGNAAGPGCGDGEYCAFRVGACFASDERGGLCTTRPSACDASDSPVCGCDGATYDSECSAAAAGVNVVYVGRCDAEPVRCDTCAPLPGAETKPCEDGLHESGPICVRGPDGTCGYQWLACPSPGSCGTLGGPPEGRCYDDGDCATGQRCEGASTCPCASECFAPEIPGYCK